MLHKQHSAENRNCWEINKCGRQSGGERVADYGVCPAATEKRLDGVHGGKNAGRSCWVVAGTLCGRGTIDGTLAQEHGNCGICDIYQSIREEEKENFQWAFNLLYLLRSKNE